jgi:hypothetical protein
MKKRGRVTESETQREEEGEEDDRITQLPQSPT